MPLLVRWPSQVRAGSVTQQTAMNMDFLPTLLDAAGVMPDSRRPPDGVSLMPTLRDASHVQERTLFWRYHAHSQGAVRRGQYKYLRIENSEFLFDVVADPQERGNLSKRQEADLPRTEGRVGEVGREHAPVHATERGLEQQAELSARPLLRVITPFAIGAIASQPVAPDLPPPPILPSGEDNKMTTKVRGVATAVALALSSAIDWHRHRSRRHLSKRSPSPARAFNRHRAWTRPRRWPRCPWAKSPTWRRARSRTR